MRRFVDREFGEKPYGRITNDQYCSLNPMAKELHDYWMKFKPEMYNELANSGKLWSLLQTEGNRLDQIVIDNLQTLGEAGAKELARAEIYDEMGLN